MLPLIAVGRAALDPLIVLYTKHLADVCQIILVVGYQKASDEAGLLSSRLIQCQSLEQGCLQWPVLRHDCLGCLPSDCLCCVSVQDCNTKTVMDQL